MKVIHNMAVKFKKYIEDYSIEADTLRELRLAEEELNVGRRMDQIPEKEFSEESKAGVIASEQEEHGFVDHTKQKDFCEVHDVKMKERDGKNGKFYSHNRGTYPNLEWCSGGGFPEERYRD